MLFFAISLDTMNRVKKRNKKEKMLTTIQFFVRREKCWKDIKFSFFQIFIGGDRWWYAQQGQLGIWDAIFLRNNLSLSFISDRNVQIFSAECFILYNQILRSLSVIFIAVCGRCSIVRSIRGRFQAKHEYCSQSSAASVKCPTWSWWWSTINSKSLSLSVFLWVFFVGSCANTWAANY